MRSVLYARTATTEAAASYVAGLVNGALASDHTVLLFLPGGSSIAVAAAAYPLLTASYLDRLTMLLTDERYGEPGHKDSNWTQLAAAGVPVLHNPRAIPVLTGLSLAETVARFDAVLREQIAKADVVIGMFGIGTDGHTAGIKPSTPAVTAEGLAAGYQGSDFVRITMTFDAVRSVDAAILSAYGAAKQPQLEELERKLPLAAQPAQILKTIPSFVVFSDHAGDRIL